MFSLGNSVVESPCGFGGSVIGRVSVADASLSLSLSLSGPPRLRARLLRRGSAAGIAGHEDRLGISRVVDALLACCSSAVAGCVSAAVLCCPHAGWLGRVGSSEEGIVDGCS